MTPNKPTKCYTVVLMALFPAWASGATLNVPGDFATIQACIGAAQVGDECVVAPGTYHELIDFLGKAITLRSSGGPDVTIIDAGPVADPGTGKPVVRCDSGEGPDTVLKGFTITGGTGDTVGFGTSIGGGMFNNGSSPTVTDCIFLENTAYVGAGMYNKNHSNPALVECAFIRNSAGDVGGGMANIDNSIPTLTECSFDDNSANKGAGMYNGNASPMLNDCTFTANVASYFNGIISEGGGMANFGGSCPTVTDCTFSQNRSCCGTSRGGGMFNGYASNPTVTNSAFIQNSSGLGGGMYSYESSPAVIDCFFFDNHAANGINGGAGSGMFNASNSAARVTGCTFEGHTTGVSAMINEGSSPIVADCMFSTNIGSGMRNNSGSSPTVDGCRFVDNTGAGMDNFRSSPTVTNCLFSRNIWAGSQWGGGMGNREGSNPMVTHCEFIANASAGNGGGMNNFDSSSPTVTNCMFSGNSAIYWGGGMYNNTSSSPAVINCVFDGNTAVLGGGGVANTTNSAAKFSSCTFAANQAGDTGGGGIYNSNSDPILTNCIFWGDSPDEVAGNTSMPIIAESDIEGGWPGGSNINDDPLFANADGTDGISGTTDDDLRLLTGSPCIDTGRSTLLPVDATDLDSNGVVAEDIPVDLDGHARVLCMEVDMGAYEFGIGDLDCDQIVTLTDFADWGSCMTAPDAQSISPACEAFDFEFDGDVDLFDWAGFQNTFPGP